MDEGQMSSDHEGDHHPDASMVRHEEELEIGKQVRSLGALRARKSVEPEGVHEVAEKKTERAWLEHTDPNEADSGKIETLPDGSVSIPLFEEQLVITKRLVVRERVIVRKEVVTEEQRIDEEVRRERLEIEADPGIEVREIPS
jgi:uncharacterized protein (TIGR02271 family)